MLQTIAAAAIVAMISPTAGFCGLGRAFPSALAVLRRSGEREPRLLRAGGNDGRGGRGIQDAPDLAPGFPRTCRKPLPLPTPLVSS